MAMVEVDVKLYIKCRLCLHKDGVYQIVPSINKLIKDCFDINTDPFDGLPQLICKKCKSTLNNFHYVKTTYKNKQTRLLKRMTNINMRLDTTQFKSEPDSCNEPIQIDETPASTICLVPALPVPADVPLEYTDSVAPASPVQFKASVSSASPVECKASTPPASPVEFKPSVSLPSSVEFKSSVPHASPVKAMASVAPANPVEPMASIAPANPVEPMASVAPDNSVEPPASVAPVNPVEPMASVASAKPVEPMASVAPDNSCEPMAPVAPVNPVKSMASVAPANPVEPMASVAPANPVEPKASVAPANPVEPKASVAFANSVKPKAFVVSTGSVKLKASVAFANSIKPKAFVGPANPVKPITSVPPANPVEPVASVLSANPVEPMASVPPEDSVEPMAPVAFANPVEPIASVVPANPVKPMASVAPANPVKPIASVAFTNPVEPMASVAPANSDEPMASVELGNIRTPLDGHHKDNDDTWKKTYNKHYLCKICPKSFQWYSGIKRHVVTHNKILKKHKMVFRKYCTVQLNKVGNKKNSTGSLNTVVYNAHKIITNKGDSHYHLVYLKKGCDEKNATNKKGQAVNKRARVSVGSSEEEITKAKKRKTRRLCSGSSAKITTVQSATNNITDPGGQDNNHVVNTSSVIDHSNLILIKKNTITIESNKPDETKVTVANYKTVQNIVTMCQKKYFKNTQPKTVIKPLVSELSLKHKVLSLGRKVIHKQGFECTGLLRYVEHKDLDISWQPAITSIKKKCNYVRIMPKLKSRKDFENDDSNYKDVHKISCRSGQAINGNDINTNSMETAIIKTKNVETAIIETGNGEKSTDEVSMSEIKTEEDQIDHDSTSNNDDFNSNNRLLNISPVLNSTQILDKKGICEMQHTVQTSDTGTHIIELDQTENAEASGSNLSMPIITSISSLSLTEKEKQPHPDTEKPAPRIKVKHPSKLMSQKPEYFFKISDDLTKIFEGYMVKQSNSPSHSRIPAVCIAAPMARSSTIPAAAASNSIAADQSNFGNDANLEYVTLHCSELPSERTKLPFQYFKMLLHYHGFALMDINEEVPLNFTNLVTFKLLLKQETKRPIGIWLSLYCKDNCFAFSFKDTYSRNFDPSKLPAFWQWELLKVYKGEVLTKILQNAAKISEEIYSYADVFLRLLKSIHCVPEI